MRHLRYLFLGMGYIEGEGHHPGNTFVALMLLLSIVAMIPYPVANAILSFTMMVSFLSLAWLYGAYERGKRFELKRTDKRNEVGQSGKVRV